MQTMVVVVSNSFASLFRTLNLKVPLTSASFSPEGAALYFGTENGKLLILDLRSLDKAPKCVNVGEGGCRIECMSFQVRCNSHIVRLNQNVEIIPQQTVEEGQSYA